MKNPTKNTDSVQHSRKKAAEVSSCLPRERFLSCGESSLTDAELLAVLLRTGVKGCSVHELSESLLSQHGGSLWSLSNVSIGELSRHRGMGVAKSVGLAAAFALGRRMVRLRFTTLPHATGPSTIADYMRSNLRFPDQEEFHALLLDNRLGLVRDVLVTVGLVDRSLVHAREVFREAIRESCSSVIVVHNHPTGDVMPSDADMEVTKMLVLSGQIIGITVLDHVIVANCLQAGHPDYFSFQEQGLMEMVGAKNDLDVDLAAEGGCEDFPSDLATDCQS